jgi:hypothetical protein
MSKVRSRKSGSGATTPRRQYTREFKEEAVRMVLDGHSVASVCQRLESSSRLHLPSPVSIPFKTNTETNQKKNRATQHRRAPPLWPHVLRRRDSTSGQRAATQTQHPAYPKN